MKIAISRLHFPVSTLGPGRRLGIWLQGCSIRCPGCVSADTWVAGRGITTVAAVVEACDPWLDEADGVTISGGEPTDQSAALLALLRAIRQRSRGDILVYTGRPWENLAGFMVQAEGLIDALITDPFEASAGQTLLLRGSDNQRLHLLTPLGRERFTGLDRQAGPEHRTLDIHLSPEGDLWMAGIPRPGDLERLRHLLSEAGFDSRTTEAPIRTTTR